MKSKLIVRGFLPFALAASLCACSSPSNEGLPSSKAENSVSATQNAPSGESIQITIGNGFTVDAGTVLSDGSIYVVGQEGASGFCAYISTDEGDSWTKEELSWADQVVTAITLSPDGTMLGVQGQEVVYAPRGEELTTVDLSALGDVDGISAVYQIDKNTFTVSGGKTESFVDEDGNTQDTVQPVPFEDVVLRYDGSKVAQWGNGIGNDSAGYYTSDGELLYYLDYESNNLCSLTSDGQTKTYGNLGNIKGYAFCREGVYYYLDDQGIAAYDTTSNSSTHLVTDSLAPYLQSDAMGTTLIVTDKNAFVVVSSVTSNTQSVYRYEI